MGILLAVNFDLSDKGHGGIAAALFITMLVLIALAQRGWDILFKRIEAAWEGRKARKPAKLRAR